MGDLVSLSIKQLSEGLDRGDFSSQDVVQAYVNRIEKYEDLNVFITKTFEQAFEQAASSDQRRAENAALGPLDGVPLGVKDLFCTQGVRTTAASQILDQFTPSYTAHVIDQLFQAGAVMLGKTNLDEFAMGSSNETSAFGQVINPWRLSKDQRLCPGGSSGGSAAAVAGDLCAAAIGTDTGGSIRQPASFCGIVGVKPTYGRCSRWGAVAFSSSLDQAGPMTKTVEDSAVLLNVMCGHDSRDSTSSHESVPDFHRCLTGDVKGLKIGIPKEYMNEHLDGEVAKYWKKAQDILKEKGAQIFDVSLPHTPYALAAYYVIAPAEASSNLARYDGVRYGQRFWEKGMDLDEMYMKTRGQGFGAEVRRRILIGTYVLSSGYYDAYYQKALKVRRRIYDDFQNVFQKVDLLLTPSCPGSAFVLGEKQSNPIEMYLNDVFTVPSSLAGLPALSLPIGLNQRGLPLGLQMIGRPFDEGQVLRCAHVLEKSVQFHHKPKEWGANVS